MGNSLVFNKSKVAPLLQPSIQGDLNQIKTLIGKHIASVGLKTKEELSAYVDQGDNEGNTALIGAVFSGHLDITKFLIEDCHADYLNVENQIGCSAFWIACGYGHLHIVEYMIHRIDADMSTDLLKVCTKRNSSGDTPFLAAASKSHCNVLSALLSALKENAWKILKETNKAGDTPLQVSVGMGHDEVLKLLLDYEESIQNKEPKESGTINMKNGKGLTPLLVACERNFASIVEELISRGTDLSTTDEKGRTALAISSFCGCMDVMKYLLSSRDACELLLHRVDVNGCTPLWLAARTGNVKMVRCLIEAGADASIANSEGLSPQDAAMKYKKKDVIDFFEVN